MVHIPAKFRENPSMRFRVTVRKLHVTDRQTDGWTDRRMGGVAISPVPGPMARREKIIENLSEIRELVIFNPQRYLVFSTRKDI